ncbi:hypothetical protein ILUMI_12443 [Ignelater luminosus]|uniref:Uncharacterized protein n=1 Tax=Ignelater luminosus TaxID=2038154 RepID=A0A8K0G6S2_IGNLU|nr:hypothetical protein ILUMI_12443 [Ignelater luminosus]
MKEPGREESELTKKYGEVDKDGIRVITVVADDAWRLTNKKARRQMFLSADNDYGAITSNMVINEDVLKATKQECIDS